MRNRATTPATKPIRMIQTATAIGLSLFDRSELRPRVAEIALGSENIAVKVCNPLSSARRHVEISDRRLDVRRNSLPVELRIQFRQVGGRFISQLPVEADLLKFIIERVGLSQILRIAELADEIGSPHERALLVSIVIRLYNRRRETREFDRASDPARV